MKKNIVIVFLLAGFGVLNAQPPKTAPKTISKPLVKTAAQPAPLLKTYADSVSYVLGEVAGFAMFEKGLGDVKITNNAAYMQALNDILGKKPTLIDDVSANALLNNYMTKLQSEKVKPEIEMGEKFLAKNKLNDNVKTTATGLQYQVITEGTGIKPTAVDTFVAHYRGTLLDSTEFDASFNRGQPLTMAVKDVIPGWIEGLQLMSVGSKYIFWIPYNLGYGVMGQGKIPGGAMLKFELELLDVKKKQ